MAAVIASACFEGRPSASNLLTCKYNECTMSSDIFKIPKLKQTKKTVSKTKEGIIVIYQS